jgi:hypothetical protein
VGRIWGDTKSTLGMNVSIQMEDFAPENLGCLAEAFNHRYHDRKRIIILIFGAHWASKYYDPNKSNPFIEDDYSKQRKASVQQMHASYVYDIERHEHYVDIYPCGHKSFVSPSNLPYTRIDLPVVSKPQYQLQINGRCLIALDDIEYPFDAKKERVTGSVTLT